jgi:hypothetical protein
MEEQKRIEAALKLLENHRKASAAYYQRIRDKKKEEGTYKKPGRPKKKEVTVV